VRRREFIAALSLTATTRRLKAQQPPGNGYRIAFFHPTNPVSVLNENGLPQYRALFGELRRLGYEEGRNLEVERYSGAGRSETYSKIASEIVATQPNLILTVGSVITGLFAAAAAGRIPILSAVNDPIATGLSTSLARPSANVTGVVVEAELEIIGKRFELLRELHPGVHHVALVTPFYVWEQPRGTASAVRQVAQHIGIRLTGLCPANPVNESAYQQAFAGLDRDRPDAILIFEGPESSTFCKVIVDLVNAARMPAIYPFRDFIDVGGLMAYAYDLIHLYRHLAHQADMILRGHPVSEVSFYQADRFSLIINLVTAKTLGIPVPPSLLAHADEVIVSKRIGSRYR
jgi:putative ABC transport system substrate-binding protein